MARRLDHCCVPVLGGRPASEGGGGSACTLGLEHYYTAQDDSTFFTTSSVFVSTGKQLVTPAIPAGTYRFGAYYLAEADWFGQGEWNVDLNGGGFVFPTTHHEEFASQSDEKNPYYRSRIMTLSPGAQTFTLQCRDAGPAPGFYSIYAYETMFELWALPPSVDGRSVCPCACDCQDVVTVHVVSGRTLAGRQFTTPPLEAGVYRLEVSYIFQRTSGSSVDFNVDRLGVDAFPNDTRERPAYPDDWCPRTQVREISLPGGAHTFDLVLDTSSSATTTLGQTCWYIHRVDGS